MGTGSVVLVVIVAAVVVFMLVQITTGNKRLKRLTGRELISEEQWLAKYADQFPRMKREDILAGLRFAADGFNFEGTLLRPDDSWGGILAPPSKSSALDPAKKDWEAMGTARGVGPDQMGALTVRDFIQYYGSKPEAQALLEDHERGQG